jgi:beta-galactosidase
MMAYGGDFDDPIHDAQFCINGLVFPDRQPHPAIAEVKHVQSPINISRSLRCSSPRQVQGFRVNVVVENRYDIIGLTNVTMQWRLLVDGMPVPKGALLERSLKGGDMERSLFAQASTASMCTLHELHRSRVKNPTSKTF